MKALFILISLLAVNPASPLPIPSREEICANTDWLSGCCCMYPDVEWPVTRPPRGFKPFYISHLGRHGARHQLPVSTYVNLLRVFETADSLGILTGEGRKAYEKVSAFCALAKGREGELTRAGELEHRHIAERMYRHYPQVFRGEGRIDVQSTNVVRSILSGVFAVERLKELNPRLQVSRSSHPGNWKELFGIDSLRAIGKKLASDVRSSELRARVFPGERLCSSFFTDPSYLKGDERWLLASRLYSLATVTRAAGCPEAGLFDFFTPDELYAMWENHNASFYYMHMRSARFGMKASEDAFNLWRRIVSEADVAIAGDGFAANLRYAHDNNVGVFLSLLGLGTPVRQESGYDDIAGICCDFLLCPFACNVQMVFFRNCRGRVLVKFLLNERETLLNGLDTDTAPFYGWEEVKAYMAGIVL